MQTCLDCIPCFIGQALSALRLVSQDEATIESALKKILEATSKVNMNCSPPEMAGEIHRIIRQTIKSTDPYQDLKEKSTQGALQAEPSVRKKIMAAKSPLAMAMRYAIAGNVIDFAIMAEWDANRLEKCLDEAAERPLRYDDTETLIEAIEKAETILILGDNAGETVFDRLLIEQMPKGKVWYAVKSGPVLNDATLADAHAVGLHRVAHLIENGTDFPGTVLQHCSKEFLDLFNRADVIIAKGQGNLESLYGTSRPVYFLSQIKCSVLGNALEAEVGDWAVLSSQVIREQQHACNKTGVRT